METTTGPKVTTEIRSIFLMILLPLDRTGPGGDQRMVSGRWSQHTAPYGGPHTGPRKDQRGSGDGKKNKPSPQHFAAEDWAEIGPVMGQ